MPADRSPEYLVTWRLRGIHAMRLSAEVEELVAALGAVGASGVLVHARDGRTVLARAVGSGRPITRPEGIDARSRTALPGVSGANKERQPMSTFMRAKMQVQRVERLAGSDRITCTAVARSGSYPADGSDEDNTYAKFSPQGELSLTIANPALLGTIDPGQKFYLDFTKVD